MIRNVTLVCCRDFTSTTAEPRTPNKENTSRGIHRRATHLYRWIYIYFRTSSFFDIFTNLKVAIFPCNQFNIFCIYYFPVVLLVRGSVYKWTCIIYIPVSVYVSRRGAAWRPKSPRKHARESWIVGLFCTFLWHLAAHFPFRYTFASNGALQLMGCQALGEYFW